MKKQETPSKKVAETEFNEVLIVLKNNNEFSYWAAWKKSICAFNDPKVWSDPSVWPTYFNKKEGDVTWGMGGYGLILMDMDKKVVWSLNDYSTPKSLHLPSDGMVRSEDDPQEKALLALLADKKAISEATVKAFEDFASGGVLVKIDLGQGKKLKELTLPLSDFLSITATPEENFISLTTSRDTLKNNNGKSFFIFKGSFIPSGYTQHDNLGVSEIEVLLNLLSFAKENGFPLPDTEDLISWAEEKEVSGIKLRKIKKILNTWEPTETKKQLKP